MNVIRATNAAEVVIDTTGSHITITVKTVGTTKGQVRAYLDLDTASVLSAVLANRVDAARRG